MGEKGIGKGIHIEDIQLAEGVRPVSAMELGDGFGVGGIFEVECLRQVYNPDSMLFSREVAWREKMHNIYVQQGRDYILNTIFKNGVRDDPLYVGLFKTDTPADGWTMANNGTTWHEDASYDEATREEFVDGALSGTTTRQLDNDAVKAEFTMNATVTLKGAFITTNSVKSGVAGNLLCACLFTEGDRPVVNNDIVKVKYTVGCKDDAV